MLFHYRDKKNTWRSIELDLEGDPTKLVEYIKATIASHEDCNVTPTDYAFPTLLPISASTGLQEASGERSGVAPEQRDNAQILSLRDVAEINKQETTRLTVKTWLSSDAGDVESTASQRNEQHSPFGGEAFPILETEPGRISLAQAAESSRFTMPVDEDDQPTEIVPLGTPLLTPSPTLPATINGKNEKVAEVEPFQSAYAMAHASEESSADQSPARQEPKRMDSTSMANVMTYQRKAAEWDERSMTATVGSKKTVESICDGTSIKDLSLEEHKGRGRGGTFTDKVMSLIPRRSNSKLNGKKKDTSPTDTPAEEKFTESNHKRGFSSSSLMPPENDSASPYMYNNTFDNTRFLTTNDHRSSEMPESSGATSPLTRLRRSFSKGEKRKSFTETGSTPNIVGLMRREGGPPVSTALVSPLHEHGGFDESTGPVAHYEKDDDDDDDYEGDSDSNSEDRSKADHENLSSETVPITADLSGFKKHALHLNPHMAPFLADRVAQEQIRRYDELVGHKIRHAKDVQRQHCGTGKHCLALGGAPAYLPARSNKKGERTQIFLMKGHPEIDKPGITSVNFQHGIPEPPVVQLPADFECSLCFKERKGMNKPSDWTKHVHEDLQPFTCTFKMCTTEKKSFKRKADWVRHEKECHRHLDEWRCNFPECQHVCYRSDNFSQHLIREHKVPDFRDKTRGSTSSKIRAQPVSQYGHEEELISKLHRTCRAASAAKPDSEPCAFCGVISPSWKKHEVHLSKHMEKIALPVLGLVARKEVSPDMTIRPIRREQVASMMRSNTGSDMLPTTDSNTLTPYSTNGSSYHQGSPGSQSPTGFPSTSQTDEQLPSYLMSTIHFPELVSNQATMSGSGFAAQHTSSPMDGSVYSHFGYGETQPGHINLDRFHTDDESVQCGGVPQFESQQQLPAFTHVNPYTARTYPPPNLQKSPARSQLHPVMVFPAADQMSGPDYVSSPHSGTSYRQSTTPSPNQPRALLMNNQLEITGSGPTVNHLAPYMTGDYGNNTYVYNEEQAPYASPLETGQYPDDFRSSVEARQYIAATTTLYNEAMTATTLPMGANIYDGQQYGEYAKHSHPPHPQPFQHYR